MLLVAGLQSVAYLHPKLSTATQLNKDPTVETKRARKPRQPWGHQQLRLLQQILDFSTILPAKSPRDPGNRADFPARERRQPAWNLLVSQKG